MRKIAIIGTAPASRAVTPFDDASWDIWVCSPGNMNQVKRATVWFELHSLVEMQAEENRGWSVGYLGWLKAQQFPVYMQEPNDWVPQATIFPYKKLITHFGTRNWFTSSPAWMLAFAIYQMTAGDELGIFGVDMAAAQEYYTMQKGGLIYWIERAQALGIKVTIPMESCLGMPTPLYGYSESSRFGRRMNVMHKLTSESMANLQQQHNNIAQQIAFHQGALESQAYFMRTALDGLDDAEIDHAEARTVISKAETTWPVDETKGTTFRMDDSGVLVPVKPNGGYSVTEGTGSARPEEHHKHKVSSEDAPL
jgi:hypothetical protein